MNNQAENQIHLDNCTFIKTILMLLVVVYHSVVFWTGNWFTVHSVEIESYPLAVLSYWLNSFHIYGFTLVSGYLFFCMKEEKNKYTNYLSFVINKMKRLIIPYCFCAAIWIVPISIGMDLFSTRDILIKFVLCESPSQLWFLWMLFWIFIIVWPMSSFLKNDGVSIAVIVVSFGIGILGKYLWANLFCIWDAFTYLPYFVLGMKLREKGNYSLYRIPVWLYVIGEVILFAVWRILHGIEGTIWTIISMGVGYIVSIAGAIMIFFVLQRTATKVRWKESKVFMFFAKRSMPIYLFHQQIIYYTIIWFNGKINPYVNATLNFVISFGGAIIISSILMRFKFTRILIGEK